MPDGLAGLTRTQLARIMPTAAAEGRVDAWLPHLNAAMIRWGAVRPNRMKYMLANVAEETGELKAKTETSYFNTSDGRILDVFSGVFGLTSSLLATWRARGQNGFDEAFFNHVYNDHNRPAGNGGGNLNPGDGFRFRGRGPMQLTWRNNYMDYFKDNGFVAATDPDLVLKPEQGAMSAAWFLAARGCHGLADRGEWVNYVVRINGGTTNMDIRKHFLALAETALADVTNPADILCIGDIGPKVESLQRALVRANTGVSLGPDGDFGRVTRRAVIAFQKKRGLPQTGIADRATRDALPP